MTVGNRRMAFLVLTGAGVIAAMLLSWRYSHVSPAAARHDPYEAATDVPRELIGYQEENTVKVDVPEPLGVAVGPADRIYVAGSNAIDVFHPNGAKLRRVSTTCSARCIAVGEDGMIFLGAGGAVEVYSETGEFLARWPGLDERSVIASINLRKDDICVADAGARVVLVYGVAGNLKRRIGEKDESLRTEGFVVPSPYFDAAVAPDGMLRAANPGRHRVETYGPEGSLAGWWGAPGFGHAGFSGCCNPAQFAIAFDGRFITCEKGKLRRVKEYDSEGRFVCYVASTEALGPGTLPLDVAVDVRGRVILLDSADKVLRIFVRTRRAG
ncbi:MAG: hypothetical protein JW909_06995 [Planctomycetes bacterium]|nr:hypothetical protein [Planctomycetota bacterium]